MKRPLAVVKSQSHFARLAKLIGEDLWARKGSFLGAYFCSLMAVLAIVLLPWPLKFIIDYAIGQQPLPEPLNQVEQFLSVIGTQLTATDWALIFAGGYALIALLGALFGAAEKMIGARIREGLVLRVRQKILLHLQQLTLTADQRSGDLVLRMIADVHHLIRLVTKTTPLLFRHLSTTVFTLTVIYLLEPLLAVTGLAVVSLFAVIVRLYGRRLTNASRYKRSQEGAVAGFTQEIIRGLPTVQALSADAHIRRRFHEINRSSLHAGVRETATAVSMERTLQIVNGCAVALTIGIGAVLVLRGQLSLGDLTVFVAYMLQLLKPVEKLNDLASAVSRGLSCGERLALLLGQSPGVLDHPDAKPITHSRGVVEFRAVKFSYGEAETPELLDDVSFRIEPGQLTVLMGPSGGGKSTLLKLMLRQLEPASGGLLLDGKPYSTITIASLREQFAVMLQQHHLFAGTLRNALWLNHTPVQDRNIWNALSQVDMKAYVESLQDGLDTDLSEDGLNFSGGQRARLSMARALLLDRPFLLLDEPLANIDARSQRIILDTLDSIRAGKTCFVISHQASLTDRADVVLSLENGKLSENYRQTRPLKTIQS